MGLVGVILPPIVCGVDDSYSDGLAALLVSLGRVGSAGTLRVITLHDALSQSRGRMLHTVADRLGVDFQLQRVRAHPARETPLSGWASPAVYLRLSIPDEIDEPTVLYLDCDLIALDDLIPLLATDLAGKPLAAVRDPWNPLTGVGIALPNCRDLGVPGGRDYFNSGVMLLDLNVCRSLGLFERAWRFLSMHPGEARLWDQDALNVAADDQWLRLDRRWNTFAFSPLMNLPGFVREEAESVLPLAELLSDEDTAAVLHFAGPLKPWNPGYPPVVLRDRYRALAAHAKVLAR
ncbi:MAG TPA: glycosyltransferase family 8 protein [Candidatus Limnocylindrales bacterium]|nr:glycosyltransferase family 8 protein [Candidatus Limnocylindrales bacterium]